MFNADLTLAVRASELYYNANMTQDDIGAELGISRWKVGRLLTAAREAGIVRITIIHPRARQNELEQKLRERYGLAEAVVVPATRGDGYDEVQERVAAAAATYLSLLKPNPRILGLSWGRTLERIAEALPQGWADGTQIVQINGGVSLTSRSENASQTAMTMARKSGGSITLLPTPAILERAETRALIQDDRTIAGVLDLAASANVFLFSAGPADDTSVLLESSYISPTDLNRLIFHGAVGDVVGRFIDAQGKIVDAALDARTLGIEHEQLRRAAISIAVIAGESKHAIASAVAASGLCTVLVTDEQTALALLTGGDQ